MKLGYLRIVAEGIRPPAGRIVEALIGRHALQQLRTSADCAIQLFLAVCRRRLFFRGIFDIRFGFGYETEVRIAFEEDSLVSTRQIGVPFYRGIIAPVIELGG